MRIDLTINKSETGPSIVMLLSLCENIKEHLDVFIAGDELDKEDVEKIRDNLKRFDVAISDSLKTGTEAGIILPIDIIFDDDITDVLNRLRIEEGASIYDHALSAPKAHDDGMKYEDVKGGYNIIAFPEDKPWQCTNIHYDIERIWWEYARKTGIYEELMEGFLESALSDTFLEDYAIRVCRENDELKKAISQIQETVEKLKY